MHDTRSAERSFGIGELDIAHVVEGGADGWWEGEVFGAEAGVELVGVAGADDGGDDAGSVADPGEGDGQGCGAESVGGGDDGLHDAGGAFAAVVFDVGGVVGGGAAAV